ncbi:MAG: HEAT repeat domain-containing protein [Nitrospiraceae bacterium]|nr:MAG: HEAT repeat domain-containing protein [Nitrospiraceae bacterium]
MDNLKAKKNRQMDVQLLSQAIIELNISLHTVSMYPKDHPIVDNSLNRAFNSLKELTAIQERIIISVAKDVLIINEQPLQEKNPVFKEFALSLNKLNIAQLTLLKGLTKEELYAFHRFLLTEVESETAEELEKIFADLRLTHVLSEFINYAVFKMEEGEAPTEEDKDKALWEQYVAGLMEGKYQDNEIGDSIEKIPPEKLAALLNAAVHDAATEEYYEKLIDAHLSRTFSKKFSSTDLQKLLEVVNYLRPELKRQFLSSAVRASSENIDSTRAALKSISSTEVMNFLSVINENMVTPPDALKSVLDEFSRLSHQRSGGPLFGGAMLEDDFLITPEMTNLLQEATYTAFVSDSYQADIAQLQQFEKTHSSQQWTKEYEQQWRDEYIEKDFNQIILELALSGTSGDMEENELELYIGIIKEQIEQFIATGQYDRVLSTLDILAAKKGNNKTADLTEGALQYFKSDNFMHYIIDSLRLVGRQRRHEALQLCEYYGDAILSHLLDALIEEDSPTIRRFMISLITHFGDSASPEIIKRLKDKRWYVIRNMLFILLECGSDEYLKKAASLCRHSNPKVSFEAIKCLMKAKDEAGIRALKDFLGSDSQEIVKKAIDLSGSFGVHEVVPELIQMLEKKNRSSTDIENKIPIVRALGLIGDHRAKEPLNNILGARSLLFRSALEHLKGEVKKALNRFPKAASAEKGARHG